MLTYGIQGFQALVRVAFLKELHTHLLLPVYLRVAEWVPGEARAAGTGRTPGGGSRNTRGRRPWPTAIGGFRKEML